MGKPAEKETAHRNLAPALQSLPDAESGDASASTPVVSAFTETNAVNTPSHHHPRQVGVPGHLTCPETSTRVLNRSTTATPSSPPRCDSTNVPRQTFIAPHPGPHHNAVKDVNASRARMRAPTSRFPELKPQVKACVLCTGDRDLPVLPDISLILQSLNLIRNIDYEHILVHTNKQIGTDFDKFFDPTDIREGAILILIISCHGSHGYDNNISLEFITQSGMLVDSRMLQEKIMALPKNCTLEIIADTCHAEGIVPGLRRISTMNSLAPCTMSVGGASSAATHAPLSGLRLNSKVTASSVSPNIDLSAPFPGVALFKDASFFFEQDRPKYRAQVVFWAASVRSGVSFTEEDLPQKPRAYSIMIAAIFKYFSSHGPSTSRRDVWENVLNVVEQHNKARHERDLRKPMELQAKLNRENRVQRPILLTSLDDPDGLLSGPIFSPVNTNRPKPPQLD